MLFALLFHASGIIFTTCKYRAILVIDHDGFLLENSNFFLQTLQFNCLCCVTSLHDIRRLLCDQKLHNFKVSHGEITCVFSSRLMMCRRRVLRCCVRPVQRMSSVAGTPAACTPLKRTCPDYSTMLINTAIPGMQLQTPIIPQQLAQRTVYQLPGAFCDRNSP